MILAMSQNMQGYPDAHLLQQEETTENHQPNNTAPSGQPQQQQQSLNEAALLAGGVPAPAAAMQQQDQQQQNTAQPQLPAGFGNTGVPPAMLLPNQPFAALLQPGGGGANNNGGNADPNGAGGSQPVQVDFNSELKRLQQLQQQMNPQAQNSNALLLPNANPPVAPSANNQMNAAAAAATMQNNQAALLQQMLDQQKLQNNNGNLMGGGAPAAAAAGFNPFLSQPGLLQDARLLLAQSQFGLIPGQANAMPEAPLPSPHSLFHRDGSRRMRGGVIEPFPEKLHRLLIEVEAAGRSDVISFVANGRAFAIHKPDKFFKEIVPLYFRQSRLSSFKRQLNLYGFELINTGPSRGGYFHELFVKDRPELCRRMRRVAVKVSTSGSNKQQGEGGGEDGKAEASGETGGGTDVGAANAQPQTTSGSAGSNSQIDPTQTGGGNNGPII